LCAGPYWWICLLLGTGVVGYLWWKASDEYNEDEDPLKDDDTFPLHIPLFVLCEKTGEVKVYSYDSPEERARDIKWLKDNPDPYCTPEGATKLKIITPLQLAPPHYSPPPKPVRQTAYMGTGTWHVPPLADDGVPCVSRGLQKKCKTKSKEFERFYADVERALGKIPDKLLTTHGKDYIWKDEHMITYVEMLRSGFKHDMKPTDEELQNYGWYNGLPPDSKDFFKSEGDSTKKKPIQELTLKQIVKEELQAILRERKNQ